MNNFNLRTNEEICKEPTLFGPASTTFETVKESFEQNLVLQKEYLETSIKAAETVSKKAKEMERVTSKFLADVAVIATVLKEERGLSPIDLCQEVLSFAADDAYQCDVRASQLLSAIYVAGNEVHDIRVRAGEDDAVICEQFGIKSAIIGNMICFRIPYLRRKISAGNDTTWFGCSKVFGREIGLRTRRELSSLGPKVKEFVTKTISYFFVKSSKSRAASLDADNHDTKHITDSILNLFPGADAPWSCSFFYTEVSPLDEISEDSTIIIVKSGKFSPATEKDFMEAVRRFF